MNSTHSPETELKELSPEEKQTALFANLVIQQVNMAMMFMGKVPHPDTGKPLYDLDSAQLVIDQLEMLQAKTKGNLSSEEGHLLQQSLMNLRMVFVEAVNNPEASSAPSASEAAPGPASAAPSAAATPAQPSADESSRVKFTKKY